MRPRHFPLVVLFALCPCCEKSAPMPQDPPPPVAEKKIPATVETAAAREEIAAAAEAAENQRARPHPRPPQPPKPEIPTAAAVTGKEGYVFSPYNNKLVDVREIPPGTLVADPTYPAEEHKVFRGP